MPLVTKLWDSYATPEHFCKHATKYAEYTNGMIEWICPGHEIYREEESEENDERERKK
jgi:hypothetical protein